MKSRSNNSSFPIGIFHEIKFLSDLARASLLWLLLSTFSLFAQTEAMQFSYSMSTNGEEVEASFDFIVSKGGGVIIKPTMPDNSFFSFETYIEDVNNPGSKVKTLASFNGKLLYYTSSLDFKCENNLSKAKNQVVKIEKLGEKTLRSLKSDSSEVVLHFSDKYQDYKIFARGIFGNHLTIPIPDSIHLNSENYQDTLKLVRTTEREWDEILKKFSKRSAGAKEMTAEELCAMGIGNSIGF